MITEAKNKASGSIAKKWDHLNEKSLNKKIIRAFIYIIDNCLACKETALYISDQLTEATEKMIPRVALEIVEDLKGDDYFIPDDKIKKKLKEIELILTLSNKPEGVGDYLFN